jgi:hypothetical protein
VSTDLSRDATARSDFLPPGGREPHGYSEFMASVDALVIGRNTFETVPAFPEWPYRDKRVVLSSSPVNSPAAHGGVVEQMTGTPAEIVSKLAASRCQHLLCRRRNYDSAISARERFSDL